MDKEAFLEQLNTFEIKHDTEKVDMLFKFMEETLSTNEKFNLTAITDRDQFVEKMIFDSALVLADHDLANKSLVDVGTGAGYPGMVLKILEPSCDVTLLDSTKKKVDYLDNFAKNSSIKVNCVSARAEDFCKANREKFDFATARAVASLPILLEIITPMLKVGGELIALKGPGYEDEINESKTALNKLGLAIVCVNEYKLPECGEQRAIIVVRKLKETNKKYPREYNEIKRKHL